MKNKANLILVLLSGILFFCPIYLVQAETSREQLKQYVADLQNSPDDQALRAKIIKLAHKVKPVLPEEAERYMARGAAAIKSAKDAIDYESAVEEFQKATLAAPWLGNAYYNLGIAQEKAGDHMGAVKNLKLYLLASPNAKDAKKVKNKIYAIEFVGEKQQKADEVLNRFKQLTYGFTYVASFCDGGRGRANEYGGRELTCNEAEYGGRNWHEQANWNGVFEFPGDGTVRFKGTLELKGTPQGPSISDIQWERSRDNGWKKIWVRMFKEVHSFKYSINRPMDGTYNPEAEYDYMSYVRSENKN